MKHRGQKIGWYLSKWVGRPSTRKHTKVLDQIENGMKLRLTESQRKLKTSEREWACLFNELGGYE